MNDISHPTQLLEAKGTWLKKILDRDERFAPAFLRYGLGIVWIWFGLQQLYHTEDFYQFIPQALSEHAQLLIYMNGGLEIALGLLLLVGFLTRIVAFVSLLHMVSIMIVVFGLGMSAIGMRNFGLAVGFLVIFLDGHDSWTWDYHLLLGLGDSWFDRVLRKIIL